jgi:outer membrane protein OmpA-like peptidoglycan-associated protein
MRADARVPERHRPAPLPAPVRPMCVGRHVARLPLDAGAVLRLQRTAGNRAVSIEIGEITVGPACPSYERGERARASSPPGLLDADVSLAGPHGIDSAAGDSVVVADFPIGSAQLRPSTVAQLRSSWIDILERQSAVRYEIVGYSDCAGETGRNDALRRARARAVAGLFPKTAARATAVGGAPVTEHAVDNATPEHRALNRSVILRLPPTPRPPAPGPSAEPEEPHVVIPRREPKTKGCKRPWREMLSVAWPAAKMMVEKALEMAYNGKGSVNTFLLERYFGPHATTNIVAIREGYQTILSKWFDWDPTFECHEQDEAHCPNATPHTVTLAYVRRRGGWPFTPTPYGTVHVCTEGFLNSIGNLQELSSTVVHELSHRLDNTGDHAYCDDPPECRLPTAKAIRNADSYAQYARSVFNRSI